MKRAWETDEYDDDAPKRPEKFQQIDSQPDEIFGSEEISLEEPVSPFTIDFEVSQSPYSPDSQSLSDTESISGSQPLSRPGSSLTEYDLALIQKRLNEFLGERITEYAAAFEASLEEYPDAFKGQDQVMIETALGSLGSFEPVTTYSEPITTHPVEPMIQDRDLAAPSFSTTSEQVIEKETREEIREKSGEVAEVEKIDEIEFDEETLSYISDTAKEIFDDTYNEFLESAIQQATEMLHGTEFSSQDLRMEIKHNAQVNQAKNESLEDLKLEIRRLIQQEDMVEG